MEERETVTDLMDNVLRERQSIIDIIEETKNQICDNYCKYPNRYDLNDEIEYDSMLDDICSHCPLNNL